MANKIHLVTEGINLDRPERDCYNKLVDFIERNYNLGSDYDMGIVISALERLASALQ